MSWLRAIGVQCVVLLITLAGCEVILRVIDLRYLRMDESGVAPVYAHHAELGWFPIPNSAQAYTGARTVNVRHNSLGLRDIEHDDTPKPTLLFLGDSFVWGYDAEEDERFTTILRGRLPDRIVNAGITAYGTDQQYLLLQRIWSRFNPSAVVLMICIDNDRIENATNLRFDGPYKPYFALPPGEFRGQPVPWSRHVYFGRYWPARHSWVVRTAISAYVYVKHPPLHGLPDPTEHLIGMMRDMVRARGATFLVGLQKRDARYEAFLAAQEIPFASFEDAETYPTHGNHWTPNGNAHVANRLMRLLADNGNSAANSGK